ncbi:hypothetical protein KI387_022366, partial [Taxus chinensis]
MDESLNDWEEEVLDVWELDGLVDGLAVEAVVVVGIEDLVVEDVVAGEEASMAVDGIADEEEPIVVVDSLTRIRKLL